MSLRIGTAVVTLTVSRRKMLGSIGVVSHEKVDQNKESKYERECSFIHWPIFSNHSVLVP